MILFLVNVILAAFWAAISGEITLGRLLLGFLFGYLVLLVSRRAFGPTQYFIKLRRLVSLMIFLVYSLILASLRLTIDILTPKIRMRPGIIGLPLEAKSDLEITVLANLISLTPGTLSLDVSDDRSTLFIHVMYIPRGDVERVRRMIKHNWERRVLELLR